MYFLIRKSLYINICLLFSFLFLFSCIDDVVENKTDEKPLVPKGLAVFKGIDDGENAYRLTWSLTGVKTTTIKEYIAEVSLDEGFNKSIYSIPLECGVKTLIPLDAKFAKPPDSPTSISAPVREISSTQARLDWYIPINSGKLTNGDSAKIRRYQVQYSENKSFLPSNNLFPTSPTDLLTELKDETKYYVRVGAINNNGINGLDVSEYIFLEDGFATSH